MSYKKFRLTDVADQAIQNQERETVLDLLTSICYRDRTFSTGEFDDAVEYVTKEKQYKDIWEPFNGNPPLFRPRVEAKDSTLTEDDFTRAVGRCSRNFCHERVEDMKALGRYLFPDEAVPPASSKKTGQTKSVDTKTVLAAIAGVAALIAAIIFLARFLQNSK